MDVHREIAAATRIAWDHAAAIHLAARLKGVADHDIEALSDFAFAQRIRWMRAEHRSDAKHGLRVSAVLAALDHGAEDEFEPSADDRA
ncbi:MULTISPECIES: hypothetical protein [unclassified Aureimonas]|uniref:hypothetical protein n=1 Tax=unclassified Aureimonas TaxID=2615206 RepID=UPI0006FAE894|nr:MULTISPECIES: hypothetical protein [unclassified Aureimonas]KQT64158.1 hypothetical protein ASG62_03945 [Aureimonas sp. Leaf427]KQT81347.1 hypothetical protein ASG54_01215 [Aureimonas sp. Leaf460]